MMRWLILACLAPLCAFQDGGSNGGSNGGDDGGAGDDGGDENPPVVEDPTSWQVWWDWNEAPYLRLAERVRTKRTRSGDAGFYLGTGQTPVPQGDLFPDTDAIREVVVPALVEALAAKDSTFQLRASALIALGRVGTRAAGELGEGRTLNDLLTEHLAHPQERVAEAATIALGLCADPDALQPLAHVLHDDDEGHRLTGRSTVPYRMRAAAAYALGLGAERAPIPDAKRYAAHHLARGMDDRTASRDQVVACALALGLCTLPVGGQAPDELEGLTPSTSRETLVHFLLERFTSEKTIAFGRAHAATSLGKLAGALDDEWIVLVADALTGALRTGGGGRNEVRQSAALALGMLGDADSGGVDEEIREALQRAAGEGDQQARFFALVALAQTGSRPGEGKAEFLAAKGVQEWLLRELRRGSSRARPWVGLALGLYARRLLGHGEVAGEEVAERLAEQLEDEGSPSDVGAFGIGLGLARGSDHRELLEQRVMDFRLRDRARGDLTVGLGLLGEERAAEMLEMMLTLHEPRTTSEDSREDGLLFRPVVLERTAVALALLGRKTVATTLVEHLDVAGSQQSRAAASQALAQVGDERAIPALVELLANDGLSSLSRAEAALALGQVCDPFALPWEASYTVGVNYRADTETFADPTRGGVIDLR